MQIRGIGLNILDLVVAVWFAFAIMRTIKNNITVATVAVMLSLLASQAKGRVTLEQLGTLGGDFSMATGINESGQIVGASTTFDGKRHAFLYSNNLMIDLDTQNTDNSIAAAINDFGQVVGANGYAYTNEFGTFYSSRAFLYDKGLMSNLIQDTNYSFAAGINDLGDIVVDKTLTNGETHAFVYTNGLMTDLGTLGGDFSGASGINNRGEIVGLSDIANQGADHPFLYNHGLMHDLGTLGGNLSAANAINDLGQVVGYSRTASNIKEHPFLYSRGRMHDLGTFGGTYSHAYGINNWGQVVGESQKRNGDYHAFLYSNGMLIDLNYLVHLTTTNRAAGFLLLITASGINDQREIVGTGAYWDGTNVTARAFLLKISGPFFSNWGWAGRR